MFSFILFFPFHCFIDILRFYHSFNDSLIHFLDTNFNTYFYFLGTLLLLGTVTPSGRPISTQTGARIRTHALGDPKASRVQAIPLYLTTHTNPVTVSSSSDTRQ